ncbi:hypothetical protein EC991_004664 [Linnemannia zychae]|nr:hypothetical protein EC991_004664 [Linnemannia zychae]
MLPRFSSLMIILIVAIASIALSSASPIPPQTYEPTLLTIDELKAAANGSCPTQTAGEHITCEDALPYINDAINKYKLVTRGQRAAYLSTMLFESGYLVYNHNLVNPSQGTTYAASDLVVDILINNRLDFQPGAWWTVSGPGCPDRAAALDGTTNTFLLWEIECIGGGVETLAKRTADFEIAYQSIH